MQDLMNQMMALIPPIPVLVFIPIALFVGLCSLLAATAGNLFHSALSLVGALFGVAAVYALLQAEFVAVSQVLIYIGAISTLIAFAIMLTRGMMFGKTSPTNQQQLAAIVTVVVLLAVLVGLMFNVPWPVTEEYVGEGQDIIVALGALFVNEYLVAFELLALLLLVALSGALLLARDRK